MDKFNVIIIIIIAAFLHQGCVSQGPTTSYTSYRIYPFCQPSDHFRYPSSLQDVIDIVNEAISRNTTVKPFGSRHSQTDIICTSGIPVNTYGLNWMRLNPDKTATFGAGVQIYDAAKFLKKHGRALLTLPGFGNITLGGAIGTGAHGSTTKYNSSISSQVVGMTIVDGLGKVRNITSEDDLRAFRIHLGLLGFLVDVTLATHPLYKTRGHNKVYPDEILTNGTLDEFIRYADQMSVYWFPFQNEVVVANWSIVDVTTPGTAYTNDHVPSTTRFRNRLAYYANEAIQGAANDACAFVAALAYSTLRVFENFFESTLLQTTPLFVPIYTEDGVTVQNPAVGYYDDMFSPVCREDGRSRLQCVWAHDPYNLTILDNEFAFPIARLSEFIGKVRDIISKVPAAFPSQGILMRFSKSSDIYMSNAYGVDSVHFEWYMSKRNDHYTQSSASLAAYQAIIQVAVKEFGARVHWGKNGLVFHGKDPILQKLDPSARMAFIAKMNEYDPNGVFLNNFGKRLKGETDVIDTDPEVTRCGLLDNCFCAKDTDCGDHQYCGDVPGYKVNVCRASNDDRVVGMIGNYNFPVGTHFNFRSFLRYSMNNIRVLLGSQFCMPSFTKNLLGP